MLLRLYSVQCSTFLNGRIAFSSFDGTRAFCMMHDVVFQGGGRFGWSSFQYLYRPVPKEVTGSSLAGRPTVLVVCEFKKFVYVSTSSYVMA